MPSLQIQALSSADDVAGGKTLIDLPGLEADLLRLDRKTQEARHEHKARQAGIDLGRRLIAHPITLYCAQKYANRPMLTLWLREGQRRVHRRDAPRQIALRNKNFRAAGMPRVRATTAR